jgi:chemotaxis methyl-accepting protein methylase
VVKDHIRKMVRFSYFDLTSTVNSPLTELDCVFCCNILIYLQKHLQERLLSMLYEALTTRATWF